MKYLLASLASVRFLLGLCLSGSYLLTYAQVPPSPNASSQAKFASTPVNLYTGIPGIQAPLMTLPGRHMSVPIGLSYHAGGFKVQEIAGPVGLGWALNAGGVITRTVQGIPDDAEYGYSGPRKQGQNVVPLETGTGNQALNYLTEELNRVAAQTSDGEPDMFYFNLMGRSGRFVLDSEGNALLMPYQDMAIKITEKDENGRFLAWQITTEDGTIYQFGTDESAREVSRVESLVYDEVTSTRTFVSSWYLKEVRSPQSSEQITFYYEDADNVTYEYRNYREYRAAGGDCDNDVFGQEQLRTRITLQPPRQLVRIESALGSVALAYEQERADLPGQYALSQVTLNDRANRTKQRIRLQYGLFNSCAQSYGVDDPGCLRLRLDRIDDMMTSTPQLVHQFDYQEDAQHFLWHRFSENYDHWGYATRDQFSFNPTSPYDHYIPQVEIDETTWPGKVPFSDATFSQAYLLTRVTNALGGYTTYDYEAHYVGSSTSQQVGGARIKSISTFDGQSLTPVYATTYDYHNSGQAAAIPTYGYIIDFQGVTCQLLVRYAQSLTNLFDLNGAAIGYSKVSARQSDGSYTTSYFTNFSDHGDEETPVYRYYSRDNEAQTYLTPSLSCNSGSTRTCQTNAPPFPPTTSYSWRRGLTRKQEQNNNNGQTINATEYAYNIDETVTPRQTIYGLKVDAIDMEFGGRFAGLLDEIFGTNPIYDNFDYHLGVYGVVSEPVYLTATITTVAEPDAPSQQVVTRTDYDVDDTYLTIRQSRSTNSEGQEIVTTYRRAPDLNNSLLMTNHMHRQVLEQSASVGGQLTQRAITTYTAEGELVVPTTTTVFPDGTGSSITVNQAYDTYGNVVQTQRLGDIPTAYLWGYNNSLRVAEVVGQTYTQATTGLNLSVLQGNDAGAIRTELNKLRKPGRLVTAYTYDPLVGITSETDPAGIATYYDYDNRNRLQYVRDHREQYVSRYQYHYQGQPE